MCLRVLKVYLTAHTHRDTWHVYFRMCVCDCIFHRYTTAHCGERGQAPADRKQHSPSLHPSPLPLSSRGMFPLFPQHQSALPRHLKQLNAARLFRLISYGFYQSEPPAPAHCTTQTQTHPLQRPPDHNAHLHNPSVHSIHWICHFHITNSRCKSLHVIFEGNMLACYPSSAHLRRSSVGRAEK